MKPSRYDVAIDAVIDVTITLRCDSLARSRYRGDEEPNYPVYKPSAGGKSY